MRIAVDAMGGDHAPSAVIEGALIAAERYKTDILLVGREDVVRPCLERLGGTNHSCIEIVHAEQTVDMQESPAIALKQKKESSINVGTQLVKQEQAQAFVSAGNTGAVMASAFFVLGRLPGVSRPAIATTIPTFKSPCIVLDVGANVDCRPQHLVHFAVMGKVYAERIHGRVNAKIGLLNIGEEKTKGNDLTTKTYELLEKMPINFIGNVEGREIAKGDVDVVVCDGFVGNAILKFGEGLAMMILSTLKSEMGLVRKKGKEFKEVQEAFKRFRKKVDYSEYGGAQLLGTNGICVISHGSSSSKAIANAIRVATEFVQHDVNTHIAEQLKDIAPESPSS